MEDGQYYHAVLTMLGHWRHTDRVRAGSAAALFLLLLGTTACSGVFSRKYEYEEDVYLRLDGSATVYVNASVRALVALRGLDLPLDPGARFDRRKVQAFFETSESHVENISSSRRDGRRYVHVRLETPDIRRLHAAAPFAWSVYEFGGDSAGGVTYRQTVGAPSRAELADAGWTGRELVAFRVHLPSRITFENSETGNVERGNIVRWEQPLSRRLRGEPLAIDVRMENRSILASTLTLFGLMIVLVAATFAMAIWFVMRRGRGDDSEAPAPSSLGDPMARD